MCFYKCVPSATFIPSLDHGFLLGKSKQYSLGDLFPLALPHSADQQPWSTTQTFPDRRPGQAGL